MRESGKAGSWLRSRIKIFVLAVFVLTAFCSVSFFSEAASLKTKAPELKAKKKETRVVLSWSKNKNHWVPGVFL